MAFDLLAGFKALPAVKAGWEWVEKKLSKPVLKVFYDPAHTGETVLTTVEGADLSGFADLIAPITSSVTTTHRNVLQSSWTPQRRTWIHLQVKNVGKTAAKDCRAFLDSVDVLGPNGTFTRHPQWVARLPLVWANTQHAQSISIHARSEPPFARLDILHFASPAQSFLIPADAASGLPVEFPSGSYELTVTVEAENCHAASCRIRLTPHHMAGFVVIPIAP